MESIYNHLLIILTYAEQHVDELPAEITENNVRYIREVVEGAMQYIDAPSAPALPVQ